MLSIGALARLGNVSVRMLRHWDAVGLLEPADVDERTGYRSYDPAQLHRLHRIVALRELGFGLDDVATMLAADVHVDRMRTLLEERRADVAREHAVAVARLADVSRRLRIIAEEETVTTAPIEIVVQPLPAMRIVARTATVGDRARMGEVVEALFAGAAEDLGHAHGALDVPIVEYRMRARLDADGRPSGAEPIEVVAGYAIAAEAPAGVLVVDVDAAELAACTVHLGPMEGIGETWAALHVALFERGLVPAGPARERYIRAERDDQDDWVTELQQPVRRL